MILGRPDCPPEVSCPLSPLFSQGVHSEQITLSEWPTLDPLALRGLMGSFVELATRDSGADKVAVLITALCYFGIEVGPKPHYKVGDSPHFANINGVIVWAPSKSRKGTSSQPVRNWIDQGVEEKRLVIIDEAFVLALRGAKNSTLSTIIRWAWDQT